MCADPRETEFIFYFSLIQIIILLPLSHFLLFFLLLYSSVCRYLTSNILSYHIYFHIIHPSKLIFSAFCVAEIKLRINYKRSNNHNHSRSKIKHTNNIIHSQSPLVRGLPQPQIHMHVYVIYFAFIGVQGAFKSVVHV